MKYVVMSFDDGAIDFKENALPILKKYNLLATINIVSGYSDGTFDDVLNFLGDKDERKKTMLSNIAKGISNRYINERFKFLNVGDIKELDSLGYEIANHTDSHVKHASYDELDRCNKKVCKWCGEKNIGIVMPRYAKPSKAAKTYIKMNKPLYVTYNKKTANVRVNLFRTIFYKIKFFIKNDDESRLNYLVMHCSYKKGKCKCFNRLSIKNDMSPEKLAQSLGKLKNNECVTLCFHSVTNNPNESLYPDGALQILDFETLCKLLVENGFNITTQNKVVLI